MKQKNKFVFASGDDRTLYAAARLAEKGYDAFTVGFGGDNEKSDIVRVFENADYVILPLTQRSDMIKTRSSSGIRVCDVIAASPSDALFFGGPMIGSVLKDIDAARVYDITSNEKFAVRNADLTAEGAVGIIINSLPFSVFGMRAAVLGYGRIGRSLTNKLCALGASVTVAARRAEVIAEASEICRATHFDALDLGAFDCIINTVPAITLGDASASISKNTYIIELASAPGGFCDAFRRERADRFINAEGLPAKTAPAPAGAAMAKAVLEILKEKK